MLVHTSSHSKSKMRHMANPSRIAPTVIATSVGSDSTRPRNIAALGMPDSELLICSLCVSDIYSRVDSGICG